MYELTFLSRTKCKISSNDSCSNALIQRTVLLDVQWNLRTRDTLGLLVLSLVERLSLSRR